MHVGIQNSKYQTLILMFPLLYAMLHQRCYMLPQLNQLGFRLQKIGSRLLLFLTHPQ
jgi:hypothetical protein